MAKAHGLRGEVVVEFYGGRPERSRPGVELTTPRGPLRIVSAVPFAGRLPGRWIVRFDGIDGREAAEGLRGLELLAEPLEDPDALWVHELVGAAVVDTAGAPLGTVVAVVANPASDLLELDGGGLIPLRFVVERRPGGPVVVDVPEGLLD